MVGTDRARQPVLRQRLAGRLQVFLKGRLVIVERAAVAPHFLEERLEFALNERASLFDAAVKVDGGNERFVAVGEKRLLPPSSGLLLAAAKEQMVANRETLGLA